MPALNLEEDNNTTTRLLTLLNVSALKNSKRKRTVSIEPTPRVKLNRRRSIDATESISAAPKEAEGKPEAPPADATGVEDTIAVTDDAEDDHGVWPVLSRTALQLTEFQKGNKTHMRTTSVHKAPTSLPLPTVRRNTTPGKLLDRTGGHSDL